MMVNLTDSGNLVLYNNETSLWESFENPTDTFLPGMSMSSSTILTSWRDRDDPRIGNYTIKRDPLLEDLNTLIIYQGDRNQSQGRRILLTDGVVKRDGLDSPTVKKLIDGIVSWTERQRDGWTL